MKKSANDIGPSLSRYTQRLRTPRIGPIGLSRSWFANRDKGLRPSLLLRSGLPVCLDDEQVGSHGGGPARLPGGLAVHLAAAPERQRRLRDALSRALRRRARRRPSAAASLRARPERPWARRCRPALLGDRRALVRNPARRPFLGGHRRASVGRIA